MAGSAVIIDGLDRGANPGPPNTSMRPFGAAVVPAGVGGCQAVKKAVEKAVENR
jgi:hypothetical protein